MIISNGVNDTLAYEVTDDSKSYKDAGNIAKDQFLEFQPRGRAPYDVGWYVTSSSIDHVVTYSPDVVVTYWRKGFEIGHCCSGPSTPSK
jgi:hypothetical protein